MSGVERSGLVAGRIPASFRHVRVAGHPFWISVVFFLMVAAPGFWLPVLSNVLAARGWEHITPWAFVIWPSAVIVSPLVFASLADQRFAAERILAVIIGGGALFLFLAFRSLQHSDSPVTFLVLFAITCLISAPGFSILTAITFHHLEGGRASEFGNYRVWGTVGWICAGLVVSLLHLDASPKSGQVAAGVRVVAGVCCLFLPHTPPRGGKPKGLREALGLGAFRLLLNRDMGIYFLTAFLFSIPLAAFYLHTPRHLEHVGWERVGAGMTLGQVTEVVAMLAMAGILARWRIRTLFLFAIACGTIRYGFNCIAGATGSVGWLLSGLVLHGVCWTFFFESGRIFVDRRVGAEMRSQAQALLSLAQGGIGSVLGTLVVAGIYHATVLRGGEHGWTHYWGILTVMCFGCGLLFFFGYRGSATPAKQSGG